MLILVFAAAISAVVHEWVDVAVVLVVVLGSAVLSLVQEYRATTAVERLRVQVRVRATVLRDGTPSAVPADEVVPGAVDWRPYWLVVSPIRCCVALPCRCYRPDRQP